MDSGKRRLFIVGAGAAGTILANSVDRKRYAVTVIDPSDTHVFQPQWLYVAFKGQKEMAKKERSLLKKGVVFIQDSVTEVDFTARSIRTESGKVYQYDYVAVATGIVGNISAVNGLAEVNGEFGDYHTGAVQARKVWEHLKAFKGGTIAIGQSYPLCKCPPSPLEGAFLTEEFINRKGLKGKTRIVFFTPYPRAYPAEAINELMEPLLKERDIEVMTFFDVDRVDAKERTIYSIEGDKIQYDLPIIIPPCSGVGIRYSPADAVGRDNLLQVDKYSMRIKGFDNAFALGDSSALPTAKSGVGAHLEAKGVADILNGNADAKFTGRTHCPFDTGYGRGTFVIGSYDEPVVKYPISELHLFMKHMMAKIYWQSLRGTFDSVFDSYFKETDPKKLEPKYGLKKQ